MLLNTIIDKEKDDWKKYHETLLTEKDVSSHLSMKDITDADYMDAVAVSDMVRWSQTSLNVITCHHTSWL